MTVYVVHYYTIFQEQPCDEILGVYSTREFAEFRANVFKEKYAYSHDKVAIEEYELNRDYKSFMAYELFDI